jgi:xylulokinase
MNCFIGVDIGTTGIRAGVYNEEFVLLGSGTGRSIIKSGPRKEIIQDPEDIYSETAGAVRKAIESAGVEKNNIKCISFDGQMAGIMGVDEHFRAVLPYDSWLDTRCTRQVALLERKAKREIIEKSGNIPSYNHGPKILWWKEHEPEIFNEIKRFVQPAGYVAGRICGLGADDAFIDWSYLHFSGFADTEHLKWDDGLLDLFGVPIRKLPRIVSPFTVIGTVKTSEADIFGLPKGIAVAAGCGDTASCFLGTGALKQGIAVDVAGTASALALTVSRLVVDLEGLVFSSRSVDKDLWYSLSYINGGGLNLEWYKDTFTAGKGFAELDEEAAALPAGSEGLIFIPHLEGRGYPNNPHMRGQWRGFTRRHTSTHFYRSILEGIAYEYALYMDKIVRLTYGPKEIDRPAFIVRGVGGGAKSRVWNQIKADVLGCQYCTITREDVSILGQGIIAQAAFAGMQDVTETVQRIVKPKEIFNPDIKRHERYREMIPEYERILAQYETGKE